MVAIIGFKATIKHFKKHIRMVIEIIEWCFYSVIYYDIMVSPSPPSDFKLLWITRFG